MAAQIRKFLGLDFKTRRSFVFYFVFTAVLIALYVVIDRFLTIQISDTLKTVSLNFVPVVVAAAVLGPVSSALVFSMGDLFGAFVFAKGAPIILLSVSYFFMGFVYGLFLYSPSAKAGKQRFNFVSDSKLNKEINGFTVVLATAAAVLINQIIFSIGVNSFILASVINPENIIGYVIATLPSRIIRASMTFVVQLVMIPLLMPIIKRVSKIVKR